MGNNARSLEISKLLNGEENTLNFRLSSSSNQKYILDETNQELIADQLELFPEPLSMFGDIPLNNLMVKLTWLNIKADKGTTFDTFSFKKALTTSSLWEIQDSYLLGKVSLCTAADGKLSAGIIVDYTPHPLNTWSRSVEISMNRVAITVTHPDNLNRHFIRKESHAF